MTAARFLLDELGAVRALPLLGWDGLGIVEARAWSARRLVVCALDPAEHRRRQTEGMLPAADPFLLRCFAAQDPRFVLAPPPVRIVGAIAVRRTWKAAIANLAGFAAFGALAAVLPAGAAGVTVRARPEGRPETRAANLREEAPVPMGARRFCR